MNKLKELRLIVKMNNRLGVKTDLSIHEQIIAEEQKEQKQLALAEEKQKSIEEQALLDRFATVLTKIDIAKPSINDPQVTITEDAGEGQPIDDMLEVTVQTSAYAPQAVPASSPGKVGDKYRMIAGNLNYFYFCTADYTGNQANIWRRVALDSDYSWTN